MHIEIVPPEQTELEGYVSEVATETRARIANLCLNLQAPEDTGRELSDALIKEYKADGRAMFNKFGTSDYANSLEGIEAIKNGMTVALLSVYQNELLTERHTYVLEGAVNAYSRWLHTKGLKAADAKSYYDSILGMVIAPHGTTSTIDRDCELRVEALIRHNCFERNTFSHSYIYITRGEDTPSWYSHIDTTKLDGRDSFPNYTGSILKGVLGRTAIQYTTGGIAMVAGFMTLDDLMKMRFTRRSLGSHIHALTGDSELARTTVDAVGREAAALSGLRIVPNDAKFSTGYCAAAVGSYALSSCMSHPVSSYDNAPYEQHPVDSYSASYYGAGDNGLALLMTLDSAGEIRGRGILNTHNNCIVRWYGEHRDKLALESLGISIDDDCLDESWLAFVHDGNHCLVPYSDGAAYGERDGNRIIIGAGDIDMQMTNGGGWYSDEEREEDCITGALYPVSELISQDNDTYYHPANTYDGFCCPVADCWYAADSGTIVTLNGGLQEVSYSSYHGLANEWDGWTCIGEDSWIDDEHCITQDGGIEYQMDCINVNGNWYLEGDEPQEDEDEAA